MVKPAVNPEKGALLKMQVSRTKLLKRLQHLKSSKHLALGEEETDQILVILSARI